MTKRKRISKIVNGILLGICILSVALYLFCVTATRKQLIAYSRIFEQVFVTLRGNEFRECVIGHTLARLCLLFSFIPFYRRGLAAS